MTFGHMAGETQATSADKDLQSYCHNTSPLMQPITVFITTTPPVGTEPSHLEQGKLRHRLSAEWDTSQETVK
ncbi:hypothetical protein HYC85_028366 [Camellia sinensis]|uniref:Uncharacterized protein n=1 Tax=Camellia sinensis TaxID=4442 RepID=A0A7J7FV31_CAMSI|nr:hypothetical protein HYC85_028366 [Camellia sinensis]